jgi:hypothetical protein
MPDDTPADSRAEELRFSLIRNDLLFRLQRRIGLIPAHGLGVIPRALFWSMLAWLPIVVSALASGQWGPTENGETLLQHFSVHLRCLVAIPLFIVAEGLSHRVTTQLLPYFVESGLVSAADVPRFRDILRNLARLRDTAYPWIVILGLVVARDTVSLPFSDAHELVWAGYPSGPEYGFGGWWFLYVSRGIYLVLILAWLWRLVLLVILFHRLAKLGLAIIPTHPDGAGGLGFVDRFAAAFSPVVLAISSVAAARWAHDVIYHGVSIQALKIPMIGLAVALLLLFLGPFLLLSGRMAAAKKKALLDYGALVGKHGRLVRRRWIDGERIADDGLLSAPELGPVADTIALYEAVARMRTIPVGKAALMTLAVPIAIPMLAVVAIQIPIRDLLLTLLKAVA